jgi:hypothetical protein
MKTRTGKRTAHFSVQIVENAGDNITMFFDGHDLPPLIFSEKTGSSGEKAFGKLKGILDEEEAKEAEVMTDPAVE